MRAKGAAVWSGADKYSPSRAPGNFYSKHVHELSADERAEIDAIMQEALDQYGWGYPDGYNPRLTPLRHTLVCAALHCRPPHVPCALPCRRPCPFWPGRRTR
jgi:hypothetical protein